MVEVMSSEGFVSEDVILVSSPFRVQLSVDGTIDIYLILGPNSRIE